MANAGKSSTNKSGAEQGKKIEAKPAAEPAAKKVAAAKPAAVKPTAAKPTAAKPTAAKPEATKPAAKPAAAPKPPAAAPRPKKSPAQPAPGAGADTAAPLEVGAPAPAFALPDENGRTVRLADFAGKKVVVYFYPKDDTPGCTRQACGFRDNLAALTGRGAVVLGISRDGAAAHTRFKNKYNLTFPLLSDPDNAVHRAYGAWGTKSMYGKTVTSALRTTVLIDARGKVVKVWPSVKVDGHVEAVLAALSVAL